MLDARNPDLSEFKSRGGKIVMYFGWADTALSPMMGIDYYENVSAKMGEGTRDFYRLFMVPGMFHCRGGFGPDRFDPMTPLINWVEGGVAPQRIEASWWKRVRQCGRGHYVPIRKSPATTAAVASKRLQISPVGLLERAAAAAGCIRKGRKQPLVSECPRG